MTPSQLAAVTTQDTTEVGEIDTAPERARVLCVDDDDAIRTLMARVLSGVGHQVDLAADGTNALELIRAQRYDAIVSDINMPGLGGLSLLREIRQRDADVPVILITGAPELESAMRAIELGAFRYIAKPLKMKDLTREATYAIGVHRLTRLRREALESIGKQSQRAGDRVGLEAQFQRALQGLWIAFQPIVSVSGKRVVGYEALMRSREAGLPTPVAVLEAAETLDRMANLGRRVRHLTAQAAQDAPAGARLFVNLHPWDLADDELYDPESPLAEIADRVVLEITERASLDQVGSLESRLGRLRNLGFSIAVDDLGSGYAGLNSFARLKPDLVKLDMDLIRGIDRDASKQRIVGSLIACARSMGVEVVVEGVETEAERSTLTALHADLMQGYLLGRPGEGFALAA